MKKPFAAMVALALLTAATPSSRLTERQRAEHALNRLAFGPRPGDIDRVMAEGVDKWIERQLHPERIDDAAVTARLASFETLKMNNAGLIDQYYKPIVEARRARKEGEAAAEDTEEMKTLRRKSQRVVGELAAQRVIRATESDRQLDEVMADFWLNHFNVFVGKGIDRFLLTSYERDVIRPHLWGKFEDLLMATAKSPAMLFYLDNARSRSGAINEDYAREIMELHTLGVDGGYTQKDVTELARVLTGWSIGRPQDRNDGAFLYRPFAHDHGEKTVLGIHFGAGGGMEEGERMIHVLAHHPSTAHHIATKLCQRLVADDPPKALVDRVARTFLDSDGDLRATVRAVVTSAEFWDPKAYRAKVKTPFEYVISALRASNATVMNPIPIARALQQIGEPLYGAQPPTGYSDKAEAWTNSGAEVSRMNFAVDLASNKLPGVRVETADPNKLALQLGSPEFQRQ